MLFNNIAYLCSIMSGDTFKEGIPLPFNLDHTDGTFILILLCFLSFAHIYSGGFTFLKESVSLIFSPRKGQRSLYEATSREIWYTYFLVAQFVTLVSVCLYSIFTEFSISGERSTATPVATIIVFIVLISAFLILKTLFYGLIGYLFDKKKEMAIWRYAHIVMIEMLGIIYFIPTLLLIYADSWHLQIAICMLVLFLAAQLALFCRLIIYFVQEKFNFLFLIAYLCTLEIIPYIFLALGLIYLYKTDDFSALLW